MVQGQVGCVGEAAPVATATRGLVAGGVDGHGLSVGSEDRVEEPLELVGVVEGGVGFEVFLGADD